MIIVERKAAELIPYTKNAKKHDETQIANVAESIRQFGFVQPLVIDKNGCVIIGHCRLLAAKKLGMDTVPCVPADTLTEEQVKALRIIDNKTNESPWDMEMLTTELGEFSLDGFDMDFHLETEELSPEEMDSLFMDAPQKPPEEPRQIQCPHCGEWFDA